MKDTASATLTFKARMAEMRLVANRVALGVTSDRPVFVRKRALVKWWFLTRLDDFEVALDDVRSPRLLRDVLHQEVDCVRATLHASQPAQEQRRGVDKHRASRLGTAVHV